MFVFCLEVVVDWFAIHNNFLGFVFWVVFRSERLPHPAAKHNVSVRAFRFLNCCSEKTIAPSINRNCMEFLWVCWGFGGPKFWRENENLTLAATALRLNRYSSCSGSGCQLGFGFLFSIVRSFDVAVGFERGGYALTHGCAYLSDWIVRYVTCRKNA